MRLATLRVLWRHGAAFAAKETHSQDVALELSVRRGRQREQDNVRSAGKRTGAASHIDEIKPQASGVCRGLPRSMSWITLTRSDCVKSAHTSSADFDRE